MKKLQCRECRRRFVPKDQCVAHLRRNPPKYCSRECGQKWRKNGRVTSCTECQKPIYRRKSHLALTIQPFCGFACYGKWQRTHPKETRTDLRIWRRQRLLAKKRDRQACRDCGENQKRLVVHHVVEREQGKPDNHALGNLVTLCDSCHRKRHR